jgi:hypothetical protein
MVNGEEKKEEKREEKEEKRAEKREERAEEREEEEEKEEKEERSFLKKLYPELGRGVSTGDKEKHRFRHVFIWLVVFFLIGYLIYFLFFTQLGALVLGEAGVGGVQVSEGLRGLTGPLSITKQILTGQYNPQNLWSSDQVQSQYQQVTDVGVVLVSVEPLKNVFDTKEKLTIVGRINAIAFPNKNINASVGACTIEGFPAACNPAGWRCEIAGSGSNKINVSDVRNRVFTCEHDAINKVAVPYTVEIAAVSEGTSTVAGKQFVFASSSVLINLDQDPLDAFGISEESLQSWQTGDDSVNVALDIAGQPSVIETDVDHFLGIRVSNPPTHTGVANITAVHLLLPTGLPPNGPLMRPAGQPDFVTHCVDVTDKQRVLRDFGVSIVPAGQDFTLCSLNFRGGIRLDPADDEIRFVEIEVPDKVLQLTGQDFGTFFILAKADYNYINLRQLPLRVMELAQT